MPKRFRVGAEPMKIRSALPAATAAHATVPASTPPPRLAAHREGNVVQMQVHVANPGMLQTLDTTPYRDAEQGEGEMVGQAA